MSSATGNRTPRAGAHRAPKTGPSRAAPAGDDGGRGRQSRGIRGAASVEIGARGANRGGPKPGGLRSKSTRRRLMAVGAVGVVVLAVFFHGGGTSPEPTVAQFLLDWETGQYQQAAALTTGPAGGGRRELQSAYKQVNANSLTLRMTSISQQGGPRRRALPGLRGSCHRPAVEVRELASSSGRRGRTGRSAGRPSVIVPGLQAGERLALVNLRRAASRSTPRPASR